MRLKYLLFIMFYVVCYAQVIAQEVGVKELDQVTLSEKSITAKQRLKKVLQSVRSNYSDGDNGDYQIKYYAARENDIVMSFKGIINLDIPSYKDLFWKMNTGSVCYDGVDIYLNQKIFDDKIDNNKAPKSKKAFAEAEFIEGNNTFYLSKTLEIIAIQTQPFINYRKNYTFRYIDVSPSIFELHFEFNKPFKKIPYIGKIPFKGKMTINRDDYAILNINYSLLGKENIVAHTFTTNGIREDDMTRYYRYEIYNVNINYAKNKEKYHLKDMDVKTKFTQRCCGEEDVFLRAYDTYTTLSKRDVDSCTKEKISLRDLNLLSIDRFSD